MPFSFSAILACTSFYSSLYLFWFYFAKHNQPIFLVLAVTLLIFAVVIIPPAHDEKKRRRFNDTFHYENIFTFPLFTWWRLFIMPIRLILSKFWD